MSDLNKNDDDRNIPAIAAADDEGLMIGLTTNIIYSIFPKNFAFSESGSGMQEYTSGIQTI